MIPANTDGVPVPQRYGAILTIILGLAVAVLDGAIANVALPTIAKDLNATPASSIWIVNAYQLAIIMSLLSLASLGDKIGYRRIYQGGLIIFGITSLFCALSDSLWTLTLARVLQGFGAAAIMSCNAALVRIIYPQNILARGIAITTLVVAVCSAAGPSVAAAVLSLASWQWLFAINLPIALVSLILALKFLPDNSKHSTQPFDFRSALMNALTFGLLISAIGGYAQGQSVLLVGTELGLMLIIGFFFVRRQLGQTAPLLPIDLLRIPIFALSMGTSICSFCAQMLAMVSLPFYLQGVMGRNPVETGLLLTPWPLAIIITTPLAGRLIGRVHAALLGGVGLALFAIGLISLAILPSQPSDADIVWRMLLCGMGFGLFQSPNNHTIITSAPKHRSGGASGMLGTARLLGQSTGAALVALMFNLFPHTGTHVSLILAAVFAATASVVSCLRMTQVHPGMVNNGQ